MTQRSAPDRQSLDIAFFGSSLVSAYWNGAATYYRGIVRALHALGHHVTFYEPDAFDRQRHRDIDDPPWARVVVYPPTEANALRLVEAAAECDVIIKASGVGVLDAELERAVLDLSASFATTVFWDVDAPATLASIEQDPCSPLRELMPRYDLVLTYGGGKPVIRRYEALGANRCIPIYNALDPHTHHPAPPDPRFECDLAFLGNRRPDREERVEEFFLRAARLAPRRRFLLGGSGWDDKALPPNVRALGHVYTADHNTLNSTALAVLNVSRESMASAGHSPATRLFEVAGAGGCIITDHWKGIGRFLEPGRETLVARSAEDVVEHLERLTPDDAADIGRRARRRVLREHTYQRRALQVQQALTGSAGRAGDVVRT